MGNVRSWVTRLLTWLRPGSPPTSAVSPFALPLVAPWTDADKSNLIHFLASPCGVKLIARMRATEARCAIAGATDVVHTVHAAGVTKGYGDAIKHLFSLSSVSDKPEAQKTQKVTTSKYAKEIESYLERVSP